jgi:hypothetical protein
MAIDEYREMIQDFETRISELGEKLDEVIIENFADIQKILKKATNGIFLAIDSQNNKIIKLIGEIVIILDDENKDIDDERIRLLEISLIKRINSRSLKIELYALPNPDNDDRIFVIKYIPIDEKMDKLNVQLQISERPKDLSTDDDIF